jgi:hypothetical protein
MNEQIYRTKDGTRVRVTKGRQFPSLPDDPQWRKDLQLKLNDKIEIVRVKDGHALWGYTLDDLIPE